MGEGYLWISQVNDKHCSFDLQIQCSVNRYHWFCIKIDLAFISFLWDSVFLWDIMNNWVKRKTGLTCWGLIVAWVYVYVWVHVWVCKHIHLCMYMHMNVYLYTFHSLEVNFLTILLDDDILDLTSSLR